MTSYVIVVPFDSFIFDFTTKKKRERERERVAKMHNVVIKRTHSSAKEQTRSRKKSIPSPFTIKFAQIRFTQSWWLQRFIAGQQTIFPLKSVMNSRGNLANCKTKGVQFYNFSHHKRDSFYLDSIWDLGLVQVKQSAAQSRFQIRQVIRVWRELYRRTCT